MAETQPAPEVPTELIDVAALQRFVLEHVPGAEPPLEAHKHEAGMSNETFFVTCGDQEWVLRRPPRGELLPTSHDVLREWRVIHALYGTGARVPRPIAACADLSVIGAPFYLMERVHGSVIREEIPAALDNPAERGRIAEELITALVEIHAADWQRVGLGDLGKPAGYLERQVRRWAGQLDLTRVHTRELPGIDEVTDWLRQSLPASGPTTLVHGDYALHNVLFSETAPACLTAVLDWEMSTLGDPLADLGYCLAAWADPGLPAEDLLTEAQRLTMREGFPARGELAAMYAEKSGRSVRDVTFYVVLAVWKLAIIGEGLYALYLEGRAANPKAAEFVERVPRTVERALRIIGESSR